jgi:hypothetical protein
MVEVNGTFEANGVVIIASFPWPPRLIFLFVVIHFLGRLLLNCLLLGRLLLNRLLLGSILPSRLLLGCLLGCLGRLLLDRLFFQLFNPHF